MHSRIFFNLLKHTLRCIYDSFTIPIWFRWGNSPSGKFRHETIKVIFLQRDREDVRVQSCPQFFFYNLDAVTLQKRNYFEPNLVYCAYFGVSQLLKFTKEQERSIFTRGC